MGIIPKGWKAQDGRDADAELRDPQQRFGKIRDKETRAKKRSRLYRSAKLPALVAAAAFAGVLAGPVLPPLSPLFEAGWRYLQSLGEPEPLPFRDAVPVPPIADRDCSYFATQAEAQRFFISQRPGDPHRLDANRDGVACETLP